MHPSTDLIGLGLNRLAKQFRVKSHQVTVTALKTGPKPTSKVTLHFVASRSRANSALSNPITFSENFLE